MIGGRLFEETVCAHLPLIFVAVPIRKTRCGSVRRSSDPASRSTNGSKTTKAGTAPTSGPIFNGCCAVQAGQVDTIVVQALDRFGVRDAWELGKFFSILKDHDCRLVDASGKLLNGDDDGTVITSTVGALTSSREQREKAGRVLTGKLTLARKGQFLGGYCPYGCDVVAFDAHGNEVWRVVYEGHDRRRKVYADGREERFDGKGNVPPKALHETLKYRPSIVAERVKYVRLIFQWYTTESITAGQIANRLNDLGVSPVFGPLWHRSVVQHLLANPIYVGRPTYNKQSNSRFMEFTGGQVKTADRKSSRRHAEADQVRPDRDEFEPMVDVKVFERAGTTLAAAKTRSYRVPKSPTSGCEVSWSVPSAASRCGACPATLATASNRATSAPSMDAGALAPLQVAAISESTTICSKASFSTTSFKSPLKSRPSWTPPRPTTWKPPGRSWMPFAPPRVTSVQFGSTWTPSWTSTSRATPVAGQPSSA